MKQKMHETTFAFFTNQINLQISGEVRGKASFYADSGLKTIYRVKLEQ